MKNPIQAFIEWYRSLAQGQRQYIAHMYIVMTTGNTADLALARDISPARFEYQVLTRDFPVRMVARMVVIRGIIDLIFINRDLLCPTQSRITPGTDFKSVPNIVDISEKQWEKGLDSWKRLRAVELSDIYTRLWLKSELEMENGCEK
ncbi:MAG: hypothetical protein GY737_15955 [Desulfobacteraceae bacterium]|nr:hypothetical protein [Desulfobacteraceae bacterium]